MKVLNFILRLTTFTGIVCSLVLTSCTSGTEIVDGEGAGHKTEFSTGSISIDNNAAVLSQRVTTYKNDKATGALEDINLIASIDPPYADYQLSASSVYVDESHDVYVTWHKRGSEYHGYIDMVDNSNEVPAITKCVGSLDVDYNYVMVDNNRLFATGDNNKTGALLCVLDLTSKTQYLYSLEGASGNCVAKGSSSYFTASGAHGGFASFSGTSTSLSEVGSKDASYAKYVASNGNMIVTLNANSDGSEAFVNFYNSNDVAFASPVSTFSVGNFLPLDGKNVCVVDNQNNVYVALGTNGVRKYSMNGDLLATNSYSANGLDFDDNYVYVASSSKGLVVLDRADLSYVTSYKNEEDASANFVKVVQDGTIYVAYGTAGILIFDWE